MSVLARKSEHLGRDWREKGLPNNARRLVDKKILIGLVRLRRSTFENNNSNLFAARPATWRRVASLRSRKGNQLAASERHLADSAATIMPAEDQNLVISV